MKKTPALIAAFATTLIMAVGMLLMGFNALFNTNGVAVAESPGQQVQATAPVSVSGTTDEQVKQLQDLVSQYQAREQQYQTQLNQAKQELNQANQQLSQQNTQLQQYQQLFQELQNRGILTVDQSGNIFLRQFGEGGDGH